MFSMAMFRSFASHDISRGVVITVSNGVFFFFTSFRNERKKSIKADIYALHSHLNN